MTNQNNTLKTGVEIILEAFQYTGIDKEFLMGDYAKAAYSHSATLNPEPTKKEVELQEKITTALDEMAFEGKAMLGIGSCIMLNAQKIKNGLDDHDRFACQIKAKVDKEIKHRATRATITTNSGLFKDQTFGNTATASPVNAYSM